jgi:predicted DCC family thiol-disulfide oxidoreductase YuxK
MRSLRLTFVVFLAPLLAYPVAFVRSWLVETFLRDSMSVLISGERLQISPVPSLVLAYVLMLFVGIPTIVVLSWRKRFHRRSLEIAGVVIGSLPPGLWMLARLPDLISRDPAMLYSDSLRLLAGSLSGFLVGFVVWHLAGETFESETPVPSSGPTAAAALLTVLYDGRCALCRRARTWLAAQPKYVSMAFVDAGSEEARRRFPSLEAGATLEELTVVGRRGEVYRGAKAWLMCLWALKRYRSAALRLSAPGMQPMARRLVAWVSRNRFRIGAAAGWTR